MNHDRSDYASKKHEREGNRYRWFLIRLVWWCAADGTQRHWNKLSFPGDHETQPVSWCVCVLDLAQMVFAAINGKLDHASKPMDLRKLRRCSAAGRLSCWTTQKAIVITGYYACNYRPIQKSFSGNAIKDPVNVWQNGAVCFWRCSLGNTVAEAQAGAYDVVNKISWKQDVSAQTWHRAICSRAEIGPDVDHCALISTKRPQLRPFFI